jgi:hypothetical protein
LKNKFSGWTPVNNDGGAALKTRLASGRQELALTQNEISNSQNALKNGTSKRH